MRRKFGVMWSFQVDVEAEDKHEAEQNARGLVHAGNYDVTVGEIVEDDPLDVVELDENGDPLD